MNPDWLIPDWPAPPQVRAVCTTRAGGVSKPPYDSLNLGNHVQDVAADVAANRQVLVDAVNARPVFLQQVHGTHVQVLGAEALDGSADGAVADASLTTLPGVACTMMVADCLPVLFTDATGRRVAAAHAGWRGLAGEGGLGVLEQTVTRMRAGSASPKNTSNQPQPPELSMQDAPENIAIMAWLGPCIGPAAFEVGDEVRAAFVAHDASAAHLFVPHAPGKWLADLAGLARHRLTALGISAVYGNDGSAAWCTVGNPSRFFSHRRDRISGRFAACIWLT